MRSSVFQVQHDLLETIAYKIELVTTACKIRQDELQGYSDSYLEELGDMKMLFDYFATKRVPKKDNPRELNTIGVYVVDAFNEVLNLQFRYKRHMYRSILDNHLPDKIDDLLKICSIDGDNVAQHYVYELLEDNDLIGRTTYTFPIVVINNVLLQVLEWLDYYINHCSSNTETPSRKRVDSDRVKSSVFLDQHDMLSKIGESLININKWCKTSFGDMSPAFELKREEATFIYNYFQNFKPPRTPREKQIFVMYFITNYRKYDDDIDNHIDGNITDYLFPHTIITSILVDILRWCKEMEGICRRRNQLITNLNRLS